jgi:hypothetical protein
VRRAQAAYDSGAKHYRDKGFARARKAFEASYDIVASPASLFMIASTYRDEGLSATAYENFDRAEKEAKQLGSEERYVKIAAESAKQRDALAPNVGLLVITVKGAGEGEAKVTVGKRELRTDQIGRPFAVPPGKNGVMATGSRGRKVLRWVRVDKGATTQVEMDLDMSAAAVAAAAREGATGAAPQPPASTAPAQEPPPAEPAPAAAAPAATQAPTPAAPPPPRDTAPPEKKSSLVPFAIASGVLGVAGFAVFGVAGAMNRSTHASLEEDCRDGACPGDRISDVDKGRTQQLVANVGLVVGAVGIAGMITILVVDAGRGGATPARAAIAASPSSISLRGCF